MVDLGGRAVFAVYGAAVADILGPSIESILCKDQTATKGKGVPDNLQCLYAFNDGMGDSPTPPLRKDIAGIAFGGCYGG